MNNSIRVKWDFLAILCIMCIQMLGLNVACTAYFLWRQGLLKTQKSHLRLEFQMIMWFTDGMFIYFSHQVKKKKVVRYHMTSNHQRNIDFYDKWTLSCRLKGMKLVIVSLEGMNHFIQLESKRHVGKLIRWTERKMYFELWFHLNDHI